MKGKSGVEGDLARLVIQAVSDRLGSRDPEVVELVTREVVAAMAGVNRVPPPSRPRTDGAVDNGDGTLTTAMGAVLPHPAGAAGEAGAPLALCASCLEQVRRQQQNRAVITTTGYNAKGVVAKMAAQVADAGGDILDISQTIISNFFTMIMIVEIGELTISFAEFKERLLDAAKELGIQAVVMHEEVMRSLQRV
jgi:ACT domain-containing protein